MEKRLKTTIQDDRISDLPDSLLLCILSCLNMKEVVRTSILSKRWQYIWISVPTLTFEYIDNSEEKTGKFIAWVNRTLLRCQNTSIEKFKVQSRYFPRLVSDVDGWARFAAEKKVRDLSLDFRFEDYRLPQSVLCNPSLTNLSLRGCRVMPRGGINWTSLKSLSIACVKINDDAIRKILSGSPMLEYLNIVGSSGFHHIDITSHESLRELVLHYYKDANEYLKISAPRLESLHLLGWWFTQIQLVNVSSLLRVVLNFSQYMEDNDDSYEEQCGYIIELLGSLHRVVELELGLHSIRTLLLLEAKALTSGQLSCLTCLKLNAYIGERDLPGIISLLKSSPNLETLVVNRTPNVKDPWWCPKFSNRVKKYWLCERRIENVLLPHLQTVKLFGFKNLGDVDKYTLELVQFLMQNAGLLEMIYLSV